VVKQVPEAEFVELDPEACQVDAEWKRILQEALDLYKLTFLAPGNMEQPVEMIKNHFFNRNDKILVNLKKLPNRDKKGVAATAIICMLKENSHVCHLDYLCVNSEYRGNGIGSTFMTKFVIPYMTVKHNRNMTLECEEKLVNWYTKMGAKKLDFLPESKLGDLPTLYSFMCFFRPDNTYALDTITFEDTQQILFEIREKFHGMGKYEIIIVEDENIDAGASATSEDFKPAEEGIRTQKIVYKWYCTI
jgi:ribosomal protein S18 acetylase RimI-like enzyme